MASLRSKELHGRADWVDRELPPFIDTDENASLFQTLGIDVAAMSSPKARAHSGAAPGHARH